MKSKVPTLTRKDIVQHLARQRNVKISEIDGWVDSVLESVRDLLMTADPEIRLELRDFGVFEVKMTKAKPRARNPKTGARLYVPPRRKTHFKPSKYMKAFLNKPLTQEEEQKLYDREADDPAVHAEDVALEATLEERHDSDTNTEIEKEHHVVG
ncbi:MAG: DNA-binding protein [Ectothiorhodospiraceae bacterium]|nr:DNA-binding protein [Ectothiorhodospiraceae bacterium]